MPDTTSLGSLGSLGSPGSPVDAPATAFGKAGASVDVDFFFLDQYGNKNTGSFSFSETASGTTYIDAVNQLHKLITTKIGNIEKYIIPTIGDFFKGIEFQISIEPPLDNEIKIKIILPSFVVNGITYSPSPFFITIQISNIIIKLE